MNDFWELILEGESITLWCVEQPSKHVNGVKLTLVGMSIQVGLKSCQRWKRESVKPKNLSKF